MKWLSLAVVVALTLGPLGHLSQSQPITPNLLVVFLWASSWFRGRSQTLTVAIVGGLTLDLVGWSWFGLWTISAVAVVLAVEALKERLLDASSIFHALLALLVVSLIAPSLLSVATKTFVIRDMALGVLGNVMLGGIIYYILAMRFRMFQRWAGRRIG